MGKAGNTQKAYDFIYHEILSGKKKLGEPISEAEIAGTLEMSRSPVREALKLLEMQGIIVHYQNRGTFVTDITRKDVAEIFELRILLELKALPNACKYMDDAVLERLKRNIENLNEKSKPEDYFKANTALHHTIVNYSGNNRLVNFYETLSMQIALVNRISARQSSHFRESRKEHLAIIEALAGRDEEAAAKCLSTHLENVRDQTMRLISELTV